MASAAPANTVAEAIKRGNIVVFFDVSIGGVPQGRLFLELFKDVAPKVCSNVYSKYRMLNQPFCRLVKISGSFVPANFDKVDCLLAIKDPSSTE